MRPPGNQRHIMPSPSQHSAQIPADTARAHDRDPHSLTFPLSVANMNNREHTRSCGPRQPAKSSRLPPCPIPDSVFSLTDAAFLLILWDIGRGDAPA